ncbi:MAG TPA: hypothetical protein VH277_12525 [Gemmatimonadaceae bacterium]|nr:hypothetical protein [Gemmatimonadaceae bacterium]
MTAPVATTHEARIRRLPVGLKRLWVGVLAAPTAWLIMEMVGYYLAARSCEPATSGVPMAGTAHPRVTQVVIDVIALIIGIMGLAIALKSWRALQPQPDRDSSPEWGRAHFMAFVGVLTSVLFLGGIFMFGIPPFLVNACSQAR